MPPSSSDPGLARVSTAILVPVAVLIAVAATATAALIGSPTLYLDASDAQLVGVFEAVEDPEAPGGVFVYSDKRYGNTRVFDGEDGALFCFEISEPGEYSLSAEVLGPNNGANAFFMQIDYFDPWVWEFPMSKEYKTEPVTDDNGDQVRTHLDAGQHVVGFYLRKSGTRLAGLNIHARAGASEPQPCAGTQQAPEETTTTSTSQPSTTSTSQPSTTSTSESVTTSTTEASTTSTSEATTTSTSQPTTTTTAAATSTTAPSGGFDVVISPTDDVNAVLQSHPEGTSFLLRAGTYRRLTLIPRSGQTITGENGTVLDGEGATPHAMGGETKANDVTLSNLKVINYTEFGIAWGAQGWGHRWVVDNCEIAHNYAGIQMKGNITVRNSYIHHNTTHGLYNGSGTSGVLIEGNDISYNHSQNHPQRARGGILLVSSSNSVVRNNHIHHNYSFGLHVDGRQEDVLIEGNVVEHNDDAGIFYELGFSATIRNNVARRNGANSSASGGHGAGILVLGATNVTIQGNTVEDNLNGIVGRQDRRTRSDGGLWELRNLRVVNNTVTMSRGHTGIIDPVDGQPALDANNVFEGNTYKLAPSDGSFFRWGSDKMSLTQWQKLHPKDG